MKVISQRAAKAEAKRIVELALAQHGEPKKSADFSKIVDTIKKEAYVWNMAAASAMMVYGPGGPKWPEAKKTAYVESARESMYRLYDYLTPHIDFYKDGFQAAVAEWARKHSKG
jgi:uncharacterized protein YozE (UPF0346 family)